MTSNSVTRTKQIVKSSVQPLCVFQDFWYWNMTQIKKSWGNLTWYFNDSDCDITVLFTGLGFRAILRYYAGCNHITLLIFNLNRIRRNTYVLHLILITDLFLVSCQSVSWTLCKPQGPLLASCRTYLFPLSTGRRRLIGLLDGFGFHINSCVLRFTFFFVFGFVIIDKSIVNSILIYCL